MEVFGGIFGLLHNWDEGVELGCEIRDCGGCVKNLTMFGVELKI